MPPLAAERWNASGRGAAPPPWAAPGPLCGRAGLLERSYALPPRFPFPPLRLVMERRPGACDLYRDRGFCAALAAGRHYEPEYQVREAIASLLLGCHRRPCRALDLGSNNGWMAAYMLALGARVTAVDPQADLAEALRETAELNCWAERCAVLTAFVAAGPRAAGRRFVLPQANWRAGGFPEGLRLPDAPLVPLDELLPPGSAFELVKMDADGPEGGWLRRLERLLSRNASAGGAPPAVRSLVVECHGCAASTLHRLQRRHGYHVYLCDWLYAAPRRFLNAKGVDVYSGFRDTGLPEYVEEMFSIRFMRHLYYLQPWMSLRHWRAGPNVDGDLDYTYVLTHERLLEPRREHHHAVEHPSAARATSGYRPAADGLS